MTVKEFVEGYTQLGSEQLKEKYVKDNPNLKIVEDKDAFEAEEYGIAVKKGNTELLDQINKSVEKMLSDGSISEWSASYSEAE